MKSSCAQLEREKQRVLVLYVLAGKMATTTLVESRLFLQKKQNRKQALQHYCTVQVQQVVLRFPYFRNEK